MTECSISRLHINLDEWGSVYWGCRLISNHSNSILKIQVVDLEREVYAQDTEKRETLFAG